MASRAYHLELTQAPYRGMGRPLRDGRLQADALLVGDDGTGFTQRVLTATGDSKGGQVHIAALPEKEEFKSHYAQWVEDSVFDSLPHRMRRHESYRAIVNLGDRAVPLIAAELRKKPGFIFLALEDILGEDPVPEEAEGNLRATVAAWLSWLRR